MTTEAEREIIKLFGPIGNFEDYWLGTPDVCPGSRDGVWVSAEKFLTALRRQEGQEPDRDAIESLLGSDGERGGGLVGATPELALVRSGLTSIGQASLDDARRRARRRIY